MQKHAKLKTLLFILVFGLLLTVLFNPIWTPVEQTIDGIQLCGQDPAQDAPTQVTITGRYGWRVFGSDVLELTLQVDGTGRPYFLSGPSDTLLSGGYVVFMEDNSELTFRGRVARTPSSTAFEILIFTPTKQGQWDAATGTLLAFPANDRAAALALLETYDNAAYDRLQAQTDAG